MAFARRNIGHDPGFRADPSTTADLQMAGQAALGRKDNEITQLGRAGYAGLRHNNAAPSEGYVVPDLDEIINPAALPDHRVRARPAVGKTWLAPVM